jgi:hypothetical protein
MRPVRPADCFYIYLQPTSAAREKEKEKSFAAREDNDSGAVLRSPSAAPI